MTVGAMLEKNRSDIPGKGNVLSAATRIAGADGSQSIALKDCQQARGDKLMGSFM